MNTQDYDDVFHVDLLEGARFDGEFDYPVIERTDSVPNAVLPFDKAIAAKDHDQWVHFFIDDKAFMRLWRNPWRYLPILSRFRGCIAPDFSIIWRNPFFLQVESVGRSRMVGSWLQRAGVDIIPLVRWGLPETYRFAFDAVAPGGTVAVGTLGCTKNPTARKVFADGMPELLRRVEPKTIVVYGPLHEDMLTPALEAGVRIAHFESGTTVKKREAA